MKHTIKINKSDATALNKAMSFMLSMPGAMGISELRVSKGELYQTYKWDIQTICRIKLENSFPVNIALNINHMNNLLQITDEFVIETKRDEPVDTDSHYIVAKGKNTSIRIPTGLYANTAGQRSEGSNEKFEKVKQHIFNNCIASVDGSEVDGISTLPSRFNLDLATSLTNDKKDSGFIFLYEVEDGLLFEVGKRSESEDEPSGVKDKTRRNNTFYIRNTVVNRNEMFNELGEDVYIIPMAIYTTINSTFGNNKNITYKFGGIMPVADGNKMLGIYAASDNLEYIFYVPSEIK